MYTILLTDDEPIVLESLTFIIEKNFPGQTVIHNANSGSEAIRISRSNKIDIYFMDINMPGLNGLETISEIKQLNPSSVIIILSAFDRFQYAQEAIALGAYRYLTKPVNRNLVAQTVRNAMGIVDTLRGKLDSDIEMKEKLSFVSPIVESDFIYSSVFSPEDGKTLQSYLNYFRITEKSFYFFCIEIPNLISEHRYETYEKIRDAITGVANCIIGPFMNARIAVYVPFTESDDIQNDAITQKNVMRNIYTKLSMKTNLKICMGVGNIFSDLACTISAYNSALSALNRTGKDGGCEFANSIEMNTDKDLASTIRNEQRLLSRITAGDIPGSQNQTSVWLSSLIETQKSLDTVRNDIFRVLLNARMYASEVRKGYSSQSAFSTTFSLISQCVTIDNFLEYLLPQITECTSILYEYKNAKVNPVVAKVRQYVEDNLSQDISLETAASTSHVNPFYLSKLFKDETGRNFIDFVTELRMEKACSLLSHSELSIKEISHETGYSDQNYFSKLFRRKFGVTPTEFRNSMISDK